MSLFFAIAKIKHGMLTHNFIMRMERNKVYFEVTVIPTVYKNSDVAILL